MLRTAILALSASIVLPTAPVFGQDAPVIAPPPPTVSAPPPAVTQPPALRVNPPAQQPRLQTAVPAPRATPAPAARVARASAPVRQAARSAPRAAPAPVADAAPAPAPEAAPAPVAEAPLPAPTAPLANEGRSGVVESGGTSMLTWLLIGGGVLLVALFAFLGLRRRGDDDVEVYYEEPAVAEPAPEPAIARAAPVAPVMAAAPVFAAAAPTAPTREVEEPELSEAAEADVEALAADSEPVAGRPWLEFLMRPIRAGTSQDDAIVQFELTVGNTGSVSAKDVRISTWMIAANEGSPMESSLIAPASAQISEVDIAAGDGALVEAEMALPKGDVAMLPVVVADARYRLPDGSEGRTHAAFAIGLTDDENELTPFPADRASGLRENVEARLHGEPERV